MLLPWLQEPTDQPDASDSADQTDGTTSEEPGGMPQEGASEEPVDEAEANKAKNLHKRK